MADEEDPGLVDLLAEEAGWTAALPDLADLATEVAGRGLKAAGVDATAVQLCLLATNDAVIANLNRDHRGKPTPTNVLSWPTYDLAPRRTARRPACRPSTGRAASACSSAMSRSRWKQRRRKQAMLDGP